MKIDFIRTKQQMYFVPVFCLIAVILGSKEYSPVVGFSYMAFLGMVFSTSPFGPCRAKESGFLALLPSRSRDRVLGRFLYGMLYMMLAVLLGGVTIVINGLTGKKVGAWMPAASFIILAACIFVMALEFLFLYLAGEYVAVNLLGIVRVVPGMVFFFLMMSAFANLEEGGAAFDVLDISVLEKNAGVLMRAGVIALAAAFMILAAVIVVCVKVTEKRDYL